MFRFLNAFFRFINLHVKLFFFIVFGIVTTYIIIDSICLCTSGSSSIYIGVLNLVFMCAFMALYLIGVLTKNIKAIGIAGIAVCTYYLFYQIFRTSQMIVYFPAQNALIYAYFSFAFIQLVTFLAALVFFVIGFVANKRFCKNMARLLFFVGVCLGVIVYAMAIAAATQFAPVMIGSVWYLYIAPFLFMAAVFLLPVTIDFLGFFDDLYKARRIKKVIYEEEEEVEPAPKKVVEAEVEEVPEEPKEEKKPKEPKEPVEE